VKKNEKITRREFLGIPPKLLAFTALSGVMGTLAACSSDSSDPRTKSPNILLIMVDQMQTPPEGYGSDEGGAQGLKEILGFRPLSPDNAYTRFFPGLLRLRQNAVVLRKHHTASAACVPSRACIMTGQYPNVTGVDQTDGIYKSADDVPFLDPEGIPTIGDWFRAVGYSTHYFGKWHVSEAEGPDYLEPWGFSDWEKSYPEPHGGTADNTGAFRDVQFADNVVDFLEKKGNDTSKVPWLAVGSLVNPHDCGAWPVNWQTPTGTGVVPWTDYPPPPPIPAMGEKSRLGGEQDPPIYVDLNPDGFPQENSSLPPTYAESLDDKPRCQKDYALKWGLAMETNTNFSFISGGLPYRSPLPFQLQGDYAEEWSLKYNQFYFYCQYLADLQLRRMLRALDDNGLADNTIVVFLSDHGDLTGAHGGMIQKWHNAYEEAIRVPMVVSSPLVNKNKQKMREILQPTSSIDFAPTVLGLAGFDEEKVRGLMKTVHGASVVKPFAGADLSSHIKGESSGQIIGPDGKPRPGVFFMSNDMITELGTVNPGDTKKACYQAFLKNVDVRIRSGLDLASGTVRQPNNVRALSTGDWKIVRYVDPRGVEPDEWELYCLKTDPVEKTNLVNFRTGEVRDDVTVPGMTKDELRVKNVQLRTDLAEQEASVFSASA
jgi:arylsulfatase A-like enzyme